MKQTILSLAVIITVSNLIFVEAQQQIKESKSNSTLSKNRTSSKIIKSKTTDGKIVLLKPDGTWKYAKPSEYEEKHILPESASKALAEFAKISGSVELNVEYDEYRSLLIDFKGIVDQALRDLPDDSLKTELSEALTRYERALKRWGNENLIKKYQMSNWAVDAMKAMDDRYGLWKENKLSLERAYEYSKQYEKNKKEE